MVNRNTHSRCITMRCLLELGQIEPHRAVRQGPKRRRGVAVPTAVHCVCFPSCSAFACARLVLVPRSPLPPVPLAAADRLRPLALARCCPSPSLIPLPCAVVLLCSAPLSHRHAPLCSSSCDRRIGRRIRRASADHAALLSHRCRSRSSRRCSASTAQASHKQWWIGEQARA